MTEFRLKVVMAVFWLLLLPTTCNTQYTSITGVWSDDYRPTSNVATPGWEYHDAGIIYGTNNTYHGYYLGDGGGISGSSLSLRENYEIERRFYCNAYNSSIDITYTIYYCNCDTSINDYVELSVNDITAQTTDASSGIFMGNGIDGLSDCNWYSKSSETVSIPFILVNNLFKIHFKISLNYKGETIALSNIQIICHPLTDSPTTHIPTVTPTNVPTITPTMYPTINPTFLPTTYPTNGPTTSAPTTSEPTNIPTNIPSHLPSNLPSYSPTEYTSTMIDGKEVDDQYVTTEYDNGYDRNNKHSSNTNNDNLLLIVVLIVICICIGGVICFILKRKQNNSKATNVAISELVTATQSRSELDDVQIVHVASDNEAINSGPTSTIDDHDGTDDEIDKYIETLGNIETLVNNIENNAMDDINIDSITNGGDNANENEMNNEGAGTQFADFEIIGDDEVTIGQTEK